ncbi:unnamed protein product [Polarella glacialis]|uniref:Peptidase A1 domain-containing protein n=1 Tax=Polarella glacialis TaxID=89957 RepID=A0A813J661_POLGL|nr:unnamed protein product [Polarella glacialis]
MTSQVLDGLRKDGMADASAFSLCLRSSGGGRLVFGSAEASQLRAGGQSGATQWVPLQTGGPHGKYAVEVQGLAVNGKPLSTRLGRAQLDSASTFTYLPREADRLLRRAVEDFCRLRNGCGGAEPPRPGAATKNGLTCWRGRGGQEISLQLFPVLSWKLQSGVQVAWPPSSYLLRQGSEARRYLYCYAFGPTDVLPDSSQVVLGASWMVDRSLLFDLGPPSRLGLRSAEGEDPCSESSPGSSSLLPLPVPPPRPKPALRGKKASLEASSTAPLVLERRSPRFESGQQQQLQHPRIEEGQAPVAPSGAFPATAGSSGVRGNVSESITRLASGIALAEKVHGATTGAGAGGHQSLARSEEVLSFGGLEVILLVAAVCAASAGILFFSATAALGVSRGSGGSACAVAYSSDGLNVVGVVLVVVVF